MKASINTPPETFTPVTLNLTFESQNELDAFYAVFNNTAIASYTRAQEIEPSHIRDTLDILKKQDFQPALHKHLTNWFSK